MSRRASERAPRSVAYLASHYPHVSHTFIQREIRALEQLDLSVLRISVNRREVHGTPSPIDDDEAARTFYVKGLGTTRIAWWLLRTAIGHPLAFLAGLAAAVRGGGWNLALASKRGLQFLEAVIVWRHCRRHGCQAIHAHFGQAPATIAMLTAAWGNRVGRDERWTWSVTIHGWQEFADETLACLAEKMASARAVACVSQFTRAQLMRLSRPQDWPKLEVVRCGLDMARFPADAALPRPVSTQPRLVMTARLSPEKGHAVLIEALQILRGRGIEVSAVLIGSGELCDEIERWAAERGVSDLVELAGALAPDAVNDLLRAADVFCLPSFAEGLPVSIMEAMALGVPVVTTFVSGIPELVVQGETGWLVPAGDAAALAAAIDASLSSPDRACIVRRARLAVEQSHDITTIAPQLRRLLEVPA